MSEKELTPDEEYSLMIGKMEQKINEIRQQQLKQRPKCERCGSQIRHKDEKCICIRFKEEETKEE